MRFADLGRPKGLQYPVRNNDLFLRRSCQQGEKNMDRLRNIGNSNRAFIAGLILFFLLSSVFLMFTSRASSFQDLAFYHNPFLNQFFSYYTNFGDGLFSIFLVIVFLIMRRYELALQVLLAFLISGLFAQVLKGMVYSPRPKDFFSLKDHIYLVEGVTLGGKASFPSGHTASAFALATSLSFYSKNKSLGIIYLIMAILVGYSRVYLSQHFPGDVFGGAIIGVLVAIWVYLLNEQILH